MNGITIVAVLLAILSTLVTWVDFSSDQQEQHQDTGVYLNAQADETINPDAIKLLRVVRYDEDKKSHSVFAVEYHDGQWRIPSHYNYPADEGQRVGRTLGSVINVEHGPLVSSDPQQHAELGVLDPLQEDGAGVSEGGYGERVTLKGEGGKLLLDLIIGKRSETAQVHYVRRAGEPQVYTAQVQLTASTKFRDWVETDLLKAAAANVRGIYIQDYSINEETQRIEPRAETGFDRLSPGHDWTSPQLPKGQMVSKDKVDGLVSTATSISLIDVQPFKEHLLQTRGFVIAQNGRIYGNEGAVMLMMNDGLVYYLFFGEVAVDEESEAGEETSNNRYLAVFTRYDETKDQTLQDLLRQQQEAAADEKNEGEEAAPEDGDAADAEAEPEAEEAERDFDAEIAARKAAGKQRAEEKQQRFSRFFYVIDDASFKRLRPSRDDLFMDPPEKQEADSKKDQQQKR